MNAEVFIPSKLLKSPVLFLVFNRPGTTRLVFEAIRQAQPVHLFVAADGPREGNPGEAEKYTEVRRIVDEGIDWDCQVYRLYRDKNLGCKIAVSSAIDWFFDHVEEGIILEDDCLPSQSFFWFCQGLLEYYRDEARVLHIGGTNPIDKKLKSNTYYFSKYNRIWGWATWRRAWKYFDMEMRIWPQLKKQKIHYRFFNTKKEADLWSRLWDDVYNGVVDTWDYQWFLCRLVNGISIIPDINLVSNIGFNTYSTHTSSPDSPLSNLPRGEIEFPLVHPKFIIEDKIRDDKWSKYILSGRDSFISRVTNKVVRALRRTW